MHNAVMPDAVMSREDVLDVFRSQDAILEGHFVLSSGRHSPVFLQKALVYRSPQKTERLCRALAASVEGSGLGPFDCVIGPAVGGIVPAYETARHLGLPFMWVEREEGLFALRRGFSLAPGSRVLIVEDIVTTGLSVRETVEAIGKEGGQVVACACLIDRSGGSAEVGVPLLALAEYAIPTYAPDEVPAELAAIPPTKPGSRGLA